MVVDQRTDSLRGTAIILAAGASTRFGSDKKTIPFANTTLLKYTVKNYAQVFRKLLVVLREKAYTLTESLPSHVEIIHATEAHYGISQSLRAGVLHALSDPWLVVGLMDMPYIKVKTLECIANRMENTNAAVVRPSFQRQYGNPVGFKQECYSHLCKLSGDQGARTIFESGTFNVEALDVDDRGILFDIDTPEQLQQYEQLLQ